MREYDISGSGGNAFAIMGVAKSLARQLDFDGDYITSQMMEGDYDNVLAVFNKYFGRVVKLVSYKGELDNVDPDLYELA